MLDTLASLIGTIPAIGLLILLALFMFYLLSEVCEDALTPALEALSEDVGIPHDVACATVVAFGSSASEIAVNSVAAFHGTKKAVSLSTGALLGSALLAFTLIPTLCVMVSPSYAMSLEAAPLARDVIFFTVTLICVVLFSRDGFFTSLECAWMIGVFALYVLTLFVMISVYGRTREPIAEEKATEANTAAKAVDYGATLETGERPTIESASEVILSSPPSAFKRLSHVAKRFIPPFRAKSDQVEAQYGRFIFISMVYIAALSEACLMLAVALASALSLSHHWTGLVIVALATQIDDFATSMATAKRGQGPGSLSNVIGSQVITLTLGLGVPFLISNLIRGESIHVINETDSALLVAAAVLVFVLCAFAGRLVLKTHHAVVFVCVYMFVVWRYWIQSGEILGGDD